MSGDQRRQLPRLINKYGDKANGLFAEKLYGK